MTAADLLRNSTSFPKQEKEFWTQPISLCESASLGSGYHHGHLTVVFARRPHGYFNVLAESGEEVNKATY